MRLELAAWTRSKAASAASNFVASDFRCSFCSVVRCGEIHSDNRLAKSRMGSKSSGDQAGPPEAVSVVNKPSFTCVTEE